MSGLASTYSIANEYDKLLAVIGAKGTNAFTSFEETVYVNDIPSNKINPWLEVEGERFSSPVLRLFHTELETVYEEKNMSLDNDNDKIFDELFAGLFKNHTYGTQTTIGTVDHLKNPSITAIKNYYAARYVPNNMALLMSGDFNPDEVIAKIDATFGKLVSKPVTPFVPASESPITKPVVKEILGPDAESVVIGYRLGGVDTKDADLMTLFSNILSNNTAGLMDLNLNQAQKVLESNAFPYVLKDYSVNVFTGKAKTGQSLDEVKDLMLSQIDLVKKGSFPDWLIPAIINNMKLDQIRSSESNMGRIYPLMDEFVQQIPHSSVVEKIDRMSGITKQDIMEFANKNYGDNYVIVYKRTGKPKESVKVVKPQISSVSMNRDDESAFLKNIMAEPAKTIEPVFIDFQKDISQFNTKSKIPVIYEENKENKTFSLYYYYDMGTSSNRALGLALDYLKYLGTSSLTPKQIQEEFYKLACSYTVYSSDKDIWISLSGLSENMPSAMALLDELFADAQPNLPALANLISDTKKRRDDAKLSKEDILWSAMYNFGVYGKKSAFTNILSSAELDGLKADELIGIIKGLTGYKHKAMYYGPVNTQELAVILDKGHHVADVLKPYPQPAKFEQLATNMSKVYTVDYDMKQVEILMLSKSQGYNKDQEPIVRMFNEYFGDGMNSIVWQEIRESKGLAYSAYAGYRKPTEPDENYYLFSYIGTQNDKLPEAMKSMVGIFNNMPESETALKNCKQSIINKIRTERITRWDVLFSYIRAQKFGINYDLRKDIFEKVPSLTMSDLKTFQQQYLKDKRYNIMVLGKKSEIDVKTLSGYGEVMPLDLKEIFGY